MPGSDSKSLDEKGDGGASDDPKTTAAPSAASKTFTPINHFFERTILLRTTISSNGS